MVPKGEAETLAKESGAKHFVVSAKNGNNISELFKDLAERVHAKQAQSKGVSFKRGGPRLTVETEKVERKKESKKCCS